jgi:hypothetical protein
MWRAAALVALALDMSARAGVTAGSALADLSKVVTEKYLPGAPG